MRHIVRLFLFIILMLVISGCSSGTDASAYRSTDPFEYYVYFPEDYKADVNWLLIVGVHGEGETGKDCFQRWQPLADDYSFVLLCPTFQVNNGELNDTDSGNRIATLLRILYSTYPFQDQFFIAGTDAGGEFALRYALRYPYAMSGVASLALERYPAPTTAAEDLPILVIVGERHSAGVESAQAFEEGMRMLNLPIRVLVLDGEDEDLSGDASRLAIEFALQASRIIP